MPDMALVDEKYRDDGKLRDQDKVDLDRYLSMRDRAPATGRGVPFFSGREREVGVFRGMVNDLSRGLAANASIVVEGPPGAGKSALMWPIHGGIAVPASNRGAAVAAGASVRERRGIPALPRR